jgi:hypothetical protein
MRANIETRLEKLERHAAPFVDRARARRKEIDKFRAFIQPDLDIQVMLTQYCGIPFSREIQEGDIIEGTFLSWAESHDRYGDARLTDEQKTECIIQADIKFYREVYGVELTSEDMTRTGEIGEQAREDMLAGVPVGESEAAQIMIAHYNLQPARLKKHSDAFAAYIAGRDSRIPDWTFNDEPEITS